MPILEIEMVMPGDSRVPPELATQLAEAAGKVFNSLPGRTWIRLRTLPQAHYAENEAISSETLPVFVSLLKSEMPPEEELREEARALARVIGQVCQRPSENVHILYQPSARGRIAFGGELLD